MDRAKTEDIPADVYIQFVRALSDNAYMLVVGGVCYWILGLMIYLRTHDPLYLGFAFLLLSISLWRYFSIRSFHRAGSPIPTVEKAEAWERGYILKGSAQGLALGSLCFVSIYLRPDDFA